MMTDPHPTVFEHRLRVYWEDTDAGGVVFYANYLKFFERGRTEWLRTAGWSQQALVENSGAMFVVAHAELRYLSPARLDDELRVTVCPQDIGRSRMVIGQQVWRVDGPLLCEGSVQIACVDRQSFRPRRIPAEILHTLTAPLHCLEGRRVLPP